MVKNYKNILKSIYKSLNINSINENEIIYFYKSLKKNEMFNELTYKDLIFYNWEISKEKQSKR